MIISIYFLSLHWRKSFVLVCLTNLYFIGYTTHIRIFERTVKLGGCNLLCSFSCSCDFILIFILCFVLWIRIFFSFQYGNSRNSNLKWFKIPSFENVVRGFVVVVRNRNSVALYAYCFRAHNCNIKFIWGDSGSAWAQYGG